MTKKMTVVLETVAGARQDLRVSDQSTTRCLADPIRRTMGLLTIVSVMASVALGQAVYSGPAVFSGSSQFGYVAGAITGYQARSDNCAVGTEAGCCNNQVPPTCATSDATAMSFQMRPSDTPPFSPLAPAYTGATDPDFHSHLIMVTDQTTKSFTTTFNMAEDGNDTDTFSYDSSMFFVLSNGGGPYFYYLNAAYARTHTCSPADTWPNACLLASAIVGGAPGNCTTGCTIVAEGPNQTFSRVATEPNVIYELAGDGVTINKLTVCRNLSPLADAICSGSPINNPLGTAPDTFARTQYVRFTDADYGVLPAGYISTWTGTFGVGDDGSITLAEGGAADWQPDTTYTALSGDTNATPTSFIFPQINNGSNPKYAFQAVTSGDSCCSNGATEPLWSNAAAPATGTTGQYICDDGTSSVSSSPQTCLSVCGNGSQPCAQWQNIGSIKGQGPGFDILNYVPASAVGAGFGATSAGYSRVNTRIGRIYRGWNEGPNYPNSGSSDPSGSMITDDALICEPYGVNPCPLTDNSTLHGASELPSSGYIPWTPTGSPGSQPYSPVTNACCLGTSDIYLGGWSSTATYVTNDAVYDPEDGPPYPLYVANGSIASGTHPSANIGTGNTQWSSGLSGGSAPVWSYNYIWQRDSLIVRPKTIRGGDKSAGAGHTVHGFVDDFGDTLLYAHEWSKPVTCATSAATSAIGCITNSSACGASSECAVYNPYPGIGATSPGIPGDDHGTYRNAGTTDTNPLGDAKTQVPVNTYGLTSQLNQGHSAGYSEFVGILPDGSGASAPCTSSSGAGAGTNCFYRFAHNFTDSLMADFAAQNNESTISQDGNWALVPTDMMGTRGSRSSDWRGGQSYAVGSYMYPQSNNTAHYDWVVSAISGTGTSGTGEPNWDSCASGTCIDNAGANQVTWTRQPGSCNNYDSNNQYANGVARYPAPVPVLAGTPGTTLNVGDIVFPVANNGYYDVFVTTVAGVVSSNSAIPAWQSICGSYGATCTYGTATMTNNGPSDCRADVMLVDLPSAH